MLSFRGVARPSTRSQLSLELRNARLHLGKLFDNRTIRERRRNWRGRIRRWNGRGGSSGRGRKASRFARLLSFRQGQRFNWNFGLVRKIRARRQCGLGGCWDCTLGMTRKLRGKAAYCICQYNGRSNAILHRYLTSTTPGVAGLRSVGSR
jgi:hypothetical protein